VPTDTEVVYSHIDIKLHPVALQLDGAMLTAITSFFKVAARDTGASDRRLDQALGMSRIQRAGVRAIVNAAGSAPPAHAVRVLGLPSRTVLGCGLHSKA
jgi:hypothetical protein